MSQTAPGPGDLIVHSCGGQPRAWLQAERDARCSACKSLIMPEQPYREGHAGLYCDDCGQKIGLCAGAEFDDLQGAIMAMLDGARAAAAGQ